MEDESVFRSIVLCLEGSKEGFFGSEDLDCRGRLFGEIDEITGMGDETGADEFADEGREVGRYGSHAGAEVIIKLGTIFGERYDLVDEQEDVVEIGLRDFSSHGYFCGRLKC